MKKISLIISFLYGFNFLRIWDLLYIPDISFPLDPVYQYPSQKGIIIGLVSLVIYFLLVFFIGFITKLWIAKENRKFIFYNVVAFIFGMILFQLIGWVFIPYNSTSGP